MAQVKRVDGPDEAVKLVARPKTVKLGGSLVPIVFDMDAFVEIERRWGSLKAYSDEMKKLDEGKLYTCVADGIAATVRDMPGGINPIKLMDPRLLVDYANVISAQFYDAMPDAGKEAADLAMAQEADRPLTGEPSSTPESSAGGWRPPTSGD